MTDFGAEWLCRAGWSPTFQAHSSWFTCPCLAVPPASTPTLSALLQNCLSSLHWSCGYISRPSLCHGGESAFGGPWCLFLPADLVPLTTVHLRLSQLLYIRATLPTARVTSIGLAISRIETWLWILNDYPLSLKNESRQFWLSKYPFTFCVSINKQGATIRIRTWKERPGKKSEKWMSVGIPLSRHSH